MLPNMMTDQISASAQRAVGPKSPAPGSVDVEPIGKAVKEGSLTHDVKGGLEIMDQDGSHDDRNGRQGTAGHKYAEADFGLAASL